MPYLAPTYRPAPDVTPKTAAPKPRVTTKVRNPFGKTISLRKWDVPANAVAEQLIDKCLPNTSDLHSRPSALNSRDD